MHTLHRARCNEKNESTYVNLLQPAVGASTMGAGINVQLSGSPEIVKLLNRVSYESMRK
jgi:hypothetical protein